MNKLTGKVAVISRQNGTSAFLRDYLFFLRFLRVRPIGLLSLHRIPARQFFSKSTNYFLGNSAVSEQRSHGVVVQVFVQELFGR
jgi:hypothetical protein